VEVTFYTHAPSLMLHVFTLYALGDVLVFFYFLLWTGVAILGVTKHSNEVGGVTASTDVSEGVETSMRELVGFDHVEGEILRA
jgi:hypothetical protein